MRPAWQPERSSASGHADGLWSNLRNGNLTAVSAYTPVSGDVAVVFAIQDLKHSTTEWMAWTYCLTSSISISLERYAAPGF